MISTAIQQLVNYGLGHRQHIRQLGQGHGRDLPLQGEHIPQLGQGLVIAPGQGLVHRHHGHVRGAGVDGDEHVHLAPGHGSPDMGLHGVLGKYVGTGHFHRAVQEAVVDRAHLHGDVPLVQGLSGPAVAGHAFDQCKLLLSIVPQQQKKYPPLPNRQFIQAQAAQRLVQLSPAQLPVDTCPYPLGRYAAPFPFIISRAR